MRRFLACDVCRGTQVLLLQGDGQYGTCHACSGLLSDRQADRLAATLGHACDLPYDISLGTPGTLSALKPSRPFGPSQVLFTMT